MCSGWSMGAVLRLAEEEMQRIDWSIREGDEVIACG